MEKQKNIMFFLFLAGTWFLFFFKGVSQAVEREGGLAVGGYGSARFSISGGNATFTMRRFVPTFSGTLADGRIKFYAELEFERFLLLELSEDFGIDKGGLRSKTEIEGTSGSEIKMEQMWGEFELARFFRFRMGGILVPLGRFNLLHDDDMWEPARRPYPVRDLSVLPEKTAWMEYGAGFLGDVEIGQSLFGYELYVLQGVSIEQDMELYTIGGRDRTIDGEKVKVNQLKLESSIKLRAGSAKMDLKNEKALAGRLKFVPTLGYELGFSGYFGRYTPRFLIPANVWSAAFDFRTDITSWFSVEGEGIFTKFEKLDDVVSDIVQKAVHKEGEVIFVKSVTGVEVEVPAEIISEVTLKKQHFASQKMGGWMLFRFYFFPSFLQGSFLDVGGKSKFVLFLRPEYVLWKGRIDKIEFKDGKIEELKKSDVQAFIGTLGIAYRPVETFVFSLSYERFLFSQGDIDIPKDAFLFGFAFGF